MALIDLSRFEPNVQQDNRQRQIYSNEGEEVYNALAKIGKGVADISIDIIDRNRKREHADYETKALNYMKETETAFDTKWSIGAKQGMVKDEEGLTYLESKNKFLKRSIQDVKDSAADSGLADSANNKLETYRSASTVDAIKQNFKLGVDASNFKWAAFSEKENKEFSEMDSNSYANYYNNKLMPMVDSLYAETSLLSVSEADKKRKDMLESVSKITLDKSSRVDFKQTPITEAVKQIMPLSVFFSADQQRLNIAFIKQLEDTGKPPEYIKLVKEANYDVTKSMALVGLSNLEKNYNSGFSNLTPAEYDTARQKLERQVGAVNSYLQKQVEYNLEGNVIQLDDIDIGVAPLTPKEAAAINRGEFGIWDNAKPEHRIDYYEKILSWKSSSKGDSKASINLEIDNWKHISETITFKDFGNINQGPDSIASLYKANIDDFKNEPAIMAENLYQASMNKLVMETALHPGKFKSRGYDAEAIHRKSLEQAASYGLPGVDVVIARGAVGAKWKVEYRKQAENAYRKFTALAQDNPMRVAFLTGSDKLLKTSNEIYKNGKFDAHAISKFNQLVRSEVGSLMTGYNRTKLDQKITQPLVDVLRNEIENGRANGDENYDLVMNKTIMKLEPDGRATVLERMLEGSGYDREMARAIIFKMNQGTETNQGMTNAVLQSNTEAELKGTNDLKGSDSSFKKKSEQVEAKMKTLFNTFYQTGKGVVNRDSVSESGVALQNYVNSELRKNSAGDPKEIAQRAFDVFYKGKASVGTSDMRGTIKLNEGETLSHVESKASQALASFRKELYSGKMPVDVSHIPLTKKMQDAGVNFKTVEGFNKFLDAGFSLQFQTLDDSGKDRTVVPVFLDENTGVKYYIKDRNHKPIRRSIP